MATDFYAVLGLPRNVTEDQIRQRFRQLARERHPDRFRGDRKQPAELEFQAITQAFNVLMDPERRRQHDLELTRPKETPSDPKQVARQYLQRGVKAYKEKNLIEAADNFDRATRSDPSNGQAWFNLAITCAQNSVWMPRALSAAERACQLEPMNAAYLKQAGRIFAVAGRNERAAEYFRQAIQWGDSDPAVQQALDDLEKPAPQKRGLFGKTT
ncbi:MAG TPA: DnaJ domain-containing protein [Thermoanaerobaculia bacterium]